MAVVANYGLQNTWNPHNWSSSVQANQQGFITTLNGSPITSPSSSSNSNVSSSLKFNELYVQEKARRTFCNSSNSLDGIMNIALPGASENSLETDSADSFVEDFAAMSVDDVVQDGATITETETVADADIDAMVQYRTVDNDSLLMEEIVKEGDFSIDLIDMSPSPQWLNVSNNCGHTALHLAVITRQSEVVRRLMVGGACVTARDMNGDTPLHIACDRKLSDIVTILLDPVWYREIGRNRYKIPYQIIPQDSEDKNLDGLTCLQLAFQRRDFASMTLLINVEADVNVRFLRTGRTLIYEALCTHDGEMVSFLRQQHECDPKIRAYDGTSFSDMLNHHTFNDQTGHQVEHERCRP